MNWAIGIDMYTLLCIKLMTNKNLLYKKKEKQQLGLCKILSLKIRDYEGLPWWRSG